VSAVKCCGQNVYINDYILLLGYNNT